MPDTTCSTRPGDDASLREWEKELRVLLHLVATQPSRPLDAQRDRIVVLQRLIASRRPVPA